MAGLKTKPNNSSIVQFFDSVNDPRRKRDAKRILGIMRKITKEKPKMWGTSIVGFGMYHYKSERSSQEGDWPLTGFSPRKQNLTIYIMPGFKKYKALLKKLGRHTVSGGSCIYIKNLEDVHIPTLEKIVKDSYTLMKKKHLHV